MAYRKTIHKNGGKRKAGRSARRMSRKAGRASRKVRRSRRAKGGGSCSDCTHPLRYFEVAS